MKRGILGILVVSLLLAMTVFSVTHVNAQATGNWITKYTITDLSTGQVYEQVDTTTGLNNTAPLLDGVELNVTLSIQVTASNPDQVLTLTTNMGHSSIEDTYWELHSTNFPGIDVNTFNPNQNTVTFNQTIGTLVISCYGNIPSGITQTQVGSITLDKPVVQTLVVLTDPAGNQLDHIEVNVEDEAISQFATLYQSSVSEGQTLSNQGVDPAYIALYQGVISTAYAEAQQGLVSNGINILTQLQNSESSSSPTAPAGTPIEATLFLPAVIVLIVVILLVGFLFMRTRGKVSYNKLVIEDQIRDLEGLTLRTAKIDKNLTISLESVKDRLKNLVEV